MIPAASHLLGLFPVIMFLNTDRVSTPTIAGPGGAIKLFVLAIGLIIPAGAARGETPSEGEKVFALQVRPVFREKCNGCHGDEAEKIEGGFDLRTRQTMLEGGDAFGETVIVPGDAQQSALLAMVTREEVGYEMPPKEAERLSQEQIWAIRDWINFGAPWPDDQRVTEIYNEHAAGITVATSGGLDPQWTARKYKPQDVWAFQPIRKDFPLLDENKDGNPVDLFINQELRKRKIDAAPPADRATLIRRATFDLTGLPPSPAEVLAFLNDPRSDSQAFAALVERLLESDHYGEQAARRWLDVVRYSDSSGFANDWERPNAWRYRDYVVRAFNDDKPFDQFTLEQIAGDELVQAAEQQGKGRPTLNDVEKTEKQIAVGFLRMGPWEHTAMSVAKITRQLFLDDITDSVGQVFLGQPLQCCRCHDHKFDPIPTRDYYSFQAAFATTQFADIDAPWLPHENRDGMEEDRRYLEQRRNANQKMLSQLSAKRKVNEAEWFQERGLPYKTRAEAIRAGLPEDEVPSRLLKSPEEFGQERIGRKWQTRFSWELDRYRPIAMTVYNGKTPSAEIHTSRISRPLDPMKRGVLEQTTVLVGGDPFAPGPSVTPAVLSAVPGASNVALPVEVEGRRTALAKWIVSADNPLAKRVLVNRIWASHFGRGIAGNPNNFGATGKKPTHPELLDWLASEFVRSGWSIKHLRRVIMNSDAYRRSTTHPSHEQLTSGDPNGDSYAAFLPRRLEAEELRDAMLKVSGELNPTLGGIPIRPDMNLEAALQPRMIMGTFAPSYVPNPSPKDRNRRSIYIHNLRGHRLPFMETFNQPGSEKSCELRDQSNITPQVFTLMNGQETNDRALALAHRVLTEVENDQAAIDRVFQLTVQRSPDALELAGAIDHWQEMTNVQSRIDPRSIEMPREVVREAIDENTGKPFKFTEQLFAYEDYQPDLQPHQVDVRTRAFADVCLMLLNSNEFIYLY